MFNLLVKLLKFSAVEENIAMIPPYLQTESNHAFAIKDKPNRLLRYKYIPNLIAIGFGMYSLQAKNSTDLFFYKLLYYGRAIFKF